MVDLHNMNKQEREEAKDEARVLSSFRHNLIVACLDAFISSSDNANIPSSRSVKENSKLLYIVMEYCEGGTLYSAARRHRSKNNNALLAENLVWKYFIQALIGS